ncbi:hypothetical protein HBH46_187470 [Parastagonospora nodorum]|nr:hypothetical protein HBH46_187470 [Parastagonospora nodorum]
MQIKNALVVAALSATVASEFAVVTRPSVNINFGDSIQSQIAALRSEVAAAIASITASAPAAELSRAASAHSALIQFVATASVSVPPEVTKIGGFTTLSATPAWFSGLPSDLRSYYDQQNSKVQSVVDSIAGGAQSASRTGGQAPKSTAAASQERVVGILGVAGAAAMAGVFAL